MYGEEKHWGNVDALDPYELNRMDRCDGEGCGLLVGVVKFVEVFVQPGPVKYAMSPVRNVVLPDKDEWNLYEEPSVSIFFGVEVDCRPSVVDDPASQY